MTRATEGLVLVPWLVNKEFDWLKRSGLPKAGNLDGGNILGIDVSFDVVKAEYPVEDRGYTTPEPTGCHILNYHSDHPSDAALRSVSTSGLKGKAEIVKVVFRSEQFIQINSGKLHGRSYSEVGDCIHNVYAAIEHLKEEDVEQLIRSHGMNDVLPHADEVIRAWDSLFGFLHKEYGEPLAVYHERPFRSLQEDGTVVIGSIDLVYRSLQGNVIIDFKTFPQVEAVTDPTSDHYAGYYAGQLNAYADALEASGENVIKRFIYYPVSGMLCEIK